MKLGSETLSSKFDEAIQRCLHPRKMPCRLQEPDYTALLTLNLPNELNLLMPQVVSSPKGAYSRLSQPLSFSGCYIHQSPYVRFVSNIFNREKTCELGDLLVLCKETLHDRTRYNAALLQLKLSRKLRIARRHQPVRIVGVRDRTQLDLYSNWPKFRFDRPLQADVYDLPEKSAFNGAQYMFVCEDAPTTFSVALPKGDMYAREYSFAQFLIDFIDWRTGKEFKVKTERMQDEWSKLIWDILDHVSEQRIQRKNIDEESVNGRYNDVGKIGLGFMQGGFPVSDRDVSRVMATIGEHQGYNNNTFGVLWIEKGERVLAEVQS